MPDSRPCLYCNGVGAELTYLLPEPRFCSQQCAALYGVELAAKAQWCETCKRWGTCEEDWECDECDA